jgi:hypothetical protein
MLTWYQIDILYITIVKFTFVNIYVNLISYN